MYVHSVNLKNIKGFESLEFNFQRPDGSYAGWTVITGDNGSGKSTLLRAIAPMLTARPTVTFSRWVSDPAAWRRMNSTDSIVEVARGFGIGRNVHDDKLSFKILENGKLQIGYPDLFGASVMSVGLPLPVSGGDEFAAGYGPFRRISGASPDAHDEMRSSELSNFVTLFRESASLAEADQWLRELDHKRLEGKADEKKLLEHLLAVFRDALLPNQVEIDRVDSDGLWLRDRHGITLTWDRMSDGYRTALALLVDIVRHMARVLPVGDIIGHDADGKPVVNGSGCVLIDEVDAHLHPEWQQTIGFWFKQHFPNVQFLVTTHSPLICQAADPNGLFVLPEPGSDDAPRAMTEDEYHRVITSRPDTILLTPAFGLEYTRSPQVAHGRAELSRLSAKRRSGISLSPDETAREASLLQLVSDEEP